MTEKEKVKLIDVSLRVLNLQINEYILLRIVRIIKLLEENNNPTIKDVLELENKK